MAKRFTKEYKQECISLVLNHGYSIKRAAETMGVGFSSLTKWVSDTRKGRTPIESVSKEESHLQRLERELKRIKTENTILKKATALLIQDLPMS